MAGDNKLSLIYVDDEEINLMLFKEMFRRDFDVYTTSSAKEALEYLKTNEVDVVVTDQRMPIMTGTEFLKALMEIKPDVPPKRVMVSGYTQEEDIEEALEKFNLARFVAKPWDYANLKAILLDEID